MIPEQRELKPCPFCGGAARIESNRDWHRLYADHDEDCVLYDANDLLMFPAQPGYLKEIADLWNRRAQVEALTRKNLEFQRVDEERCLQIGRLETALQRAKVEALTVPQWQPIETAPRDGRTLLLGRFNSMGNWLPMRGQWFSAAAIAEEWEEPDAGEEGWYETAVEPDVPNCWAISPTYWMLPPAAPTIPAIPGMKEEA